MAHWAEIDENSIVVRVVVGDNNEPDEGYQWLIDNLGGTWIKTSYNGNIRKNFAGIGYSYDPIRDAFILPKPLETFTLPDGTIYISKGWVLNEDTCQWEELTE